MKDNFKCKLKGFFWGFIISSVLFIGIPTFAQSTVQTIEVSFNSVKLMVNGSKVNVDNILYNGTTYAPIRAVAEMLGNEVGWDEQTNTASINDKDLAPKVPDKLYIKSAYWGGDSNIPEFLYKHIGPEDFIISVSNWENVKEEGLNEITGAFQELADKEFTLSADGYPDVKVYLPPTANRGASPTKSGDIAVWKISVPDDSFEKIVSGVKYKIIPSNNSEYKWIVNDDVRLVKP